jgi:hypothetical protein
LPLRAPPVIKIVFAMPTSNEKAPAKIDGQGLENPG